MQYQPPGRETLRALETAPNIYLILSPDLHILTASDLYLEATQNKREVITGQHIFEAFPDNPNLPDADGVQNINASLQEVLRTKKPHYMRVQRYDVPDIENPGQFIQRYWDPSHTPIFTPDGEIHYIIQLATNVTERVMADEAFAEQIVAHKKLQISEKHFRHLADIVPAKISNALPNGEVTFFNQQWLDYAGMSFEDMRDFGYLAMMHPDEIHTFQTQLAEAAAKGIPLESEMRFKDTNGNYRWHLNIASPILNENGEITMWVGSTTDIQRLKEEEQRKTDFIGMVSHELKTPLTSLSAYLQLLQSRALKTGDTFTAPALDKSVNQVKKMTTMINGFLNVSRLQSAKISINKQSFNISELLEDLKSETSATISSHQINFSEPAKDLRIMADRDKIEQVINNLVSNAVKYSPAGTGINIACLQVENNIRFSVADQGFGIKPEDQQKLFGLYYRIENPQSKNISGFGIGLYLCAEIIKLHAGKIWVESQPGIGTIFYFNLPIEG
jgi:PAS domain S-box-containing protein